MALACGFYQDWLDTQSTEIASDILATITAGAPTRTPTCTPTPTSTPTPSPTPTLTPTPTDIPTPAPTPLPDFSYAVLTKEDMPFGFEEVSFSDVYMAEEFEQLESFFAFRRSRGGHIELIMGYTMLLDSRSDRSGFTMMLDNPELMAELFASGIGVGEIVEQVELPDVGDIGDESSGVTMVIDVEGSLVRIDIIMFQRDILGAIVFGVYEEGYEPTMPVGDAARLLGDKIEAILSGDLRPSQ
jgi:hypothetical protein